MRSGNKFYEEGAHLPIKVGGRLFDILIFSGTGMGKSENF